MKTILSGLISVSIMLLSCQPPQDEIPNADKLFTLLPPTLTGIDFKNPIEENEKENHLINDMLISGAGVAVGDINNDGLADLFFTGNQVQDRLYLNKGKLKFEDITDEAGILPDNIWSSGVTFGDVNADGYQDIYVTKYTFGESQLSENLLYINNGDLTFTERAAEWGLADRGFSVQATFLDFDMDGFLDLYLINQPPSLGNRQGNKISLSRLKSLHYTDKMYRNNGNGTYDDVTAWCGINNLAFGLSATVGDFNNDLLPDMYVANDYEKPDHLYINQGKGKFADRTNQAIKHISNFSMGTDVADYDNDGFLDVMVVDMVPEGHKRIKTNMGGMDPKAFWDIVNQGWHYQYMFNTLQRNNGNGTFSDVAHLAGVSNTDWSWSALFGDFDNDGWKDLFITNGVKRAMRNSDLDIKYNTILDSLELVAQAENMDLWETMNIMDLVEMAPIERLTNYIFRNNGDLTFDKKTEEWGLDLPTLSYGAAYGDLDNDGDLELIVNNTDDYAHIYRNNAIEQKSGNYLRLTITNEEGGPAYGAKVRIYKDGKFWQLQELTNVRGYKSKSEDVLHFGLGDHKQVEKVEITWSYGHRLIIENVGANQSLKIDPSMTEGQVAAKPSKSYLFSEVTDQLGIHYKHIENDYDDFQKEVLLPHKMSNFGPGLATGDVNGDELEDFYVGGAAGYSGALFLQQPEGGFVRAAQTAWGNDSLYEDLGAEFFDANGDGNLDLYVVSGGNEFEPGDISLQDRLYVNDGKGNFKLERNRLPEMHTSGSKVVPADYDSDGDLDLFVGGRLLPGKYPWPAKSYILRNDNGNFVDVTEEVAPDMLKAGLVTTAVWTDFSGDGKLDLAIAGEWMPITLLKNLGGSFENVTAQAGLDQTVGWYYALVSEDFDHDGDYDFVAGNLGLNYKYKASSEEPFEIYSDDFDKNGRLDIVLSYHEQGEIFPLRGKSCSTDQMPLLKEKFPTFESFGEANLKEIYGPQLDKALNYRATTFASSYVENLGDGSFRISKLPNEAQLSSINNIIVQDYNQDGSLDLLISGNLYPVEIETPRNDAGMGLFITGDGEGNFTPVPLTESGFFAPHDAKDMKVITIGKGVNKRDVILVANNDYWLQAIQYNPGNLIKKQQLISLK
ncbi:MAG: VCBS repeat-containing protein [Cyclobacteriaceae bacterium]